MARQDHAYVNLDRNLVEVVDTCVSTLFSNGSKIYRDRKDFITKAIQNQIEKEKKNYIGLGQIIAEQKHLQKQENKIIVATTSANKSNSRGGGGKRLNVHQ